MSDAWKSHLDELRRRRRRAEELGGEARIAAEHGRGRWSARERIEALVDPGSFQEVGKLAALHTRTRDGAPRETLPSSLVCGFGRVDGRPVAVGAEDYSVAMAPWTGLYLEKSKGVFPGYLEDMAFEWEIPIVLFLQSVGGDVDSASVDAMNTMPSALSGHPVFALLERVPSVTAVMGPTAGGSAARAVCAHFSLMSRPNGCLFGGGPPLAEHALGEKIDKFELGGHEVHTRASGMIDNGFDTEAEAIEQIRRFLSYLPSNVHALPPRAGIDPDDPPERDCEVLGILDPERPRRAFDPRKLVDEIFDRGSFFEIGPDWGPSLATGLARIGGMPVGVLANDSRHAGGALGAAAADKQVRLVELCDTFHLPVVYLVDSPGIMVGAAEERAGILRRASRALLAIQRATVPVVTLHVRRVFGLGTMAAGNPNRLGIKLAWPGVRQGAMGLPIEGAAAIMFKDEIAAAEDPQAALAEVVERLQGKVSVWKAAENFSVEDLIDPRETRRVIHRWLETATWSQRAGPKRGPQYRP